VDQELDVVKLKQLLEVCTGDEERGRIEKRLKVLVEEETSIRKTTSGEVGGVATRTDVSGQSSSASSKKISSESRSMSASSSSSKMVSSSSSKSSSVQASSVNKFKQMDQQITM